MLAAILAQGGSQAQAIGGIAIGAAGTGIYSGYNLADGDEFTALDLVSAANPSGAYFTTRAYKSTASPGLRAPASGPLAVEHDVDPSYTGWQDQNRGTPVASFSGTNPSHSIVTGEGGGALRLRAIRQTAGEQTALATGVSGQIERSAMIHSGGRLWWNGPAIIEFRSRVPAGPAGQHPSLWAIAATPVESDTGNEYGFEGSSTTQQTYQISWTGSGASAVSGQTASLGTTYHDGNWHTFTAILSATDWKFYIDETLVNTINTSTPNDNGNRSDYFLLSNHVYNGAFLGDNYSAAAWAAASSGVDIDVEWVRVWRKSTGAHYAPLTTIADTAATAGGTVSIVLPSQSALWGATGLTEYVQAIPSEVEEPGGSNTTAYLQFPSGLSYNSGTRTLSGTMPAQSGVLHLAVGVMGDGNTCKPARFRINVAPVFTGATSQLFTNGTPVSLDVYPMWDVGRLFQAGANPKGLTATSLPAGLSFSSSTGLITGTPTTNGSGTIVLTATNSAGQQTSQNVTYTTSAAAGGVAAPTLSGSPPTLVASFDFNDSTVTTSAGSITQITGSDGKTTYTLTGSGATAPTLVARTGKNTARFTSASSQYLQMATALGNPTSLSMVVVYEPATTAATQAILDLAATGAPFAGSRDSLIASSSTGYSMRKNDNTSTQSNASVGTPFTTGIRLLVGVANPGASGTAEFNLDGQGTAIVAGATSAAPSSFTHLTLGATRESGAQAKFADGYVWRVLVYSGVLSATNREEIAVWATTNYGTTNAA